MPELSGLRCHPVKSCARIELARAELDRLPGYVLFRLETDSLQKDETGFNRVAAVPAPGVTPSRPLSLPNRWTWALFAFDALFLVALPTFAATTGP